MRVRGTGIFIGKTWSRRAEGQPPSPQSKWNANNRLKLQAHEAVRQALLRGELRRGQCEVCGSFRVDAHHDDYSLPLAVRFFCRLHHQAHHASLRRASA